MGLFSWRRLRSDLTGGCSSSRGAGPISALCDQGQELREWLQLCPRKDWMFEKGSSPRGITTLHHLLGRGTLAIGVTHTAGWCPCLAGWGRADAPAQRLVALWGLVRGSSIHQPSSKDGTQCTGTHTTGCDTRVLHSQPKQPSLRHMWVHAEGTGAPHIAQHPMDSLELSIQGSRSCCQSQSCVPSTRPHPAVQGGHLHTSSDWQAFNCLWGDPDRSFGTAHFLSIQTISPP